MKIAYFDLHKNEIHEDYSVNPRRYGGGAAFARHAKQSLNADGNVFKIFAAKDSFDNFIDEDNRDSAFVLSQEQINRISSGEPVGNVLKGLYDLSSFDVLMHHHCGVSLNLSGLAAKQVYWALFYNSGIGHAVDLALLYSDRLGYSGGQRAKIAYVKLGKPVEESFCLRKKEDLIFQCSRHDEFMNSIEIAKQALKYKIKTVFAGPIFRYPLLDFIDNETTFYLGQISEKEKIEWLKRAKFSTYAHNWDTVYNLSCVESLACGTPIICSRNHFFENTLKIVDGENGFFYKGDLLECFERYDDQMQMNCYNTALPFSEKEMVNSFVSAINSNLFN